jgi:hypothetical protein
MTIHTSTRLRAKNRQLDRRQRKAARVIAARSRGAALHLTSSKCGSDFVLSDGTGVPSDIVNGGLFPTIPQTWRYIGF